jgi:hypothetical protein
LRHADQHHFGIPELTRLTRLQAEPFRDQQADCADRQGHRDHHWRAQPGLDRVGKQPADDDDGDRAGDDQPAEALPFTVPAGQRAGRRGNQLRDIGAKEHHHREQRADVARDVERQTKPPRIPPEKRAHQDQVTGARYRQELGKPLHDAEQGSRD